MTSNVLEGYSPIACLFRAIFHIYGTLQCPSASVELLVLNTQDLTSQHFRFWEQLFYRLDVLLISRLPVYESNVIKQMIMPLLKITSTLL